MGTKAKVVNKIVREASGVHNYTLVPPIVGRNTEPIEIDPDTHPLMKPYREQSNTNPVMCSFGHRPKSASRTFHPGTMKIRLRKGEVVQPNGGGKNGFGLPPSVLSKLLHAPKIYHPGEEFEDPKEEKTLADPHNLFLSNEELFETSPSQKVYKKNKTRSAPARLDSLKVGEQSWSSVLPDENDDSPGGSPNKFSGKQSKLAPGLNKVNRSFLFSSYR